MSNPGASPMFVNEMTRLAIIGPPVKMTNPMIHGRRNRNAQRVSSRPRSRRRRANRPGWRGATAVAVIQWSPSGSRSHHSLGRVQGVLAGGVRLLEGFGRIGALVQDTVDSVPPGLLEVDGAAGGGQCERMVGRVEGRLHGLVEGGHRGQVYT